MTTDSAGRTGPRGNVPKLVFAWLAVGIPLVWGVIETLRKAMALFA